MAKCLDRAQAYYEHIFVDSRRENSLLQLPLGTRADPTSRDKKGLAPVISMCPN